MSVLAGIHINDTLSNAPRVTARVGDRIYPLLAAQGAAKFPFIVFDLASGPSEGDKDGDEERVTASINVFARSYHEAVTTAYEVKRAMRLGAAEYEGFEVEDTRFAGSSEDYNEDLAAYIVNLNYELLTKENYD